MRLRSAPRARARRRRRTRSRRRRRRAAATSSRSRSHTTGDAAVGLDVRGVVGVADQPAGGVPVARQQADEATGDLSVAAGDEYVHAMRAYTGRGSRSVVYPSKSAPSASGRCAARAARGSAARPADTGSGARPASSAASLRTSARRITAAPAIRSGSGGTRRGARVDERQPRHRVAPVERQRGQRAAEQVRRADAVAGVAERGPGGQPAQPDDRGAVRGGDVDRPAPGVRHPAARELREEAHEVGADLRDDLVVDLHPPARPRARRHPPAGPAEHDPVVARRAHVVQQRAPVGDRLAAAPAERVDHVRHRLGADDVAGGDRQPVAQRRRACRSPRSCANTAVRARTRPPSRSRTATPSGDRAACRSRGCPRGSARRARSSRSRSPNASRAGCTVAPRGTNTPPRNTGESQRARAVGGVLREHGRAVDRVGARRRPARARSTRTARRRARYQASTPSASHQAPIASTVSPRGVDPRLRRRVAVVGAQRRQAEVQARHEAAVAPARPVAAAAGLEHHDARVGLGGEHVPGGPQPGVAAADDDDVGARARPRAAAAPPGCPPRRSRSRARRGASGARAPARPAATASRSTSRSAAGTSTPTGSCRRTSAAAPARPSRIARLASGRCSSE